MAKIQAYCAPMTLVEARLVVSGSVPAGKTLTAGQVISVGTIDNTIGGNYSVYSGIAPVDVKTATLAVVINGGFEQLPDGRRPEGQPDYTQYVYNAGEVFTAVVLDRNLRFQITKDALAVGANPVVGQYLVATNALNTLTSGATITSSDCLLVEGTKYFRTGGVFGWDMIPSYVVSARVGNVVA